MVLDWTIGDQNCSEARKDPETYACKENTICREPEFGNGYLCNCRNGFEGNPYLSNGCQDIDECETLKPCNNSICHNTIGSFFCSCLKGYEGNGSRNGTDCSPKVNKGTPVVTQIAIGMSIGFLAIFMFISWSFWAFKQRKTAKMREKYFKQNGGNLLQQLSKSKGSQEQKVLAKYFVSLMKENRLHDIVDGRMLDNEVKIEQLKEVADLAAQCVRVKGEERPTMKEVAHELAGLQAMGRYQWGKRNLKAEESEYLLGGEELGNIYGDYGTSSSIGYDSINNQVAFELEGAR
ncbi:hypothetical protein GQ457_18G018520 [Hibiscus cannabinus]